MSNFRERWGADWIHPAFFCSLGAMLPRARRTLSCASCIVLAIGCGSCGTPAVVADGWQPEWIDAPPRLDVDLGIEPMRWAPVKTVGLRWDFSQGKGFGYAVRSKLRTTSTQSKKPPEEMETEGAVMFRPLGDGRAEVKLTTHLIAGAGSPTVRTHVVDEYGRLEDPDPQTQSMFQLIFPMLDVELSTGQMHEDAILIPDAGGIAETRGAMTMGIVGFAKVAGARCAIVALDHEARIWASSASGEPLEQTGSELDLHLIGYYDVKAGRYVAVAIREASVMVHGSGETRTERTATYVLKGLAP